MRVARLEDRDDDLEQLLSFRQKEPRGRHMPALCASAPAWVGKRNAPAVHRLMCTACHGETRLQPSGGEGWEKGRGRYCT